MHAAHLLLLALLVAFVSACSAPPSESWVALDESALTDSETQQLASATAARDELARTLMLRLLEGMQSGGAAASINICKEAAPAIAAEISANQGVAIGRTAARLRNTENAPPAWAAAYVDAHRAEPLLLKHSGDGRLAALFPIKLQSQCLQCHGPEDRILPEVRDALKAAYPDDQATGFNEGDLRGWFHVTVPNPS